MFVMFKPVEEDCHEYAVEYFSNSISAVRKMSAILIKQPTITK